jgi:hypothetical protein
MPGRRKTDAAEISEALRATLMSPNVPDSNFEPANLVDVVDRLARGMFAVSKSLDNLADAVREARTGD